MGLNVTVWAGVELPGFHRWPTAPDSRDYLRSRHRHLFGITAHVAVGHDDRDVEFHDLQDLIRAWWAAAPATGPARECGPMSCEALARELWTYLEADHGLTVSRIDVCEDGECGATLTR